MTQNAGPSPVSRSSGEVSLTLPADPRFASPAARMIEELGQAFDMPPETWGALALACEEVVAHVARHADSGSPITVVCGDERHRMTIDVSLPAKGFDPRLFNITQSMSESTDDEMDELGLLLAARMVDEFAFARDGGRLRLHLSRSRPYPRLEAASDLPGPSADGGGWSSRPPSRDRLASLCRLAVAAGGAPSLLAHPGRVIDMAAVGELDGFIAENADGLVVGGGLWLRGRIVEFYGPYLSDEWPGVAEAAVEACLIAEARGSALGVICRHPGSGFPTAMFETIGALAPTVDAPGRSIHFRELREDPGATVWTIDGIEGFLRAVYRDLGFARRVAPFVAGGGYVERHSVIAATTHREDGVAVLRPSLPGADATENIAQHCRHLESNGFPDLLCEVDLGQSWQLEFCPGLLAAGFSPRFIIPHGGESDVLVLQRATGNGR